MEAIRLLEEGFKPEQIDAAVKYRAGLPMGLFEVVDFSGVDTVYNVLNEVRKGDLRWKCPNCSKGWSQRAGWE